mgnify:CR=1 FL=1
MRSQSMIFIKIMKIRSKRARLDAFIPSCRFVRWQSDFFNAFNEGMRLVHCVKLAEKLFGNKIAKLGGDRGYSSNANRTFCSASGIETSFSQKGRKREAAASANEVRKELARVRATAMEGSFGTQKEHYGLQRVNGRIKKTEILIIFFGIHTANAVQLAKRIAEAELSQAA